MAYHPEHSTLRAINYTFGVSRVVGFGSNGPAQVPRELMSALMARCDETGQLLASKSLNIGDRVQVIDGPFACYVATVERLSTQQRISVLLNFMGRDTRVVVNVSDLGVLSEAQAIH